MKYIFVLLNSINIEFKKREASTYKGNVEALSSNHFCCGKAINTSITYSECVRVDYCLSYQHTKRMRRIIVICGLSSSAIFFHITS
jgi:hypothetical protein